MSFFSTVSGRNYFDIVIGNRFLCIERSGHPFTHRDLWRDERGDLNIYFMGWYVVWADSRATTQPPAVQA